MEGACSKRKPAAQLTKDNVDQLESGREPSAEADGAQELKEADPETLKNRRRLKIVRTHGPPASAVGEQQKSGEKETPPKAETAATAPEAKEAPAPAASAAEGVSPTAEAAPVTNADDSKNGAAAAAAAAAPAAATHEPAVLNGETAQNSNSNSNSTNNTESGGGLFGSVLKGTPAFVSPFGSLGATGSSFLLPSSGNAAAPSLFGGPQAGGPPAADAEDAEAPPPEEPTIVATSKQQQAQQQQQGWAGMGLLRRYRWGEEHRFLSCGCVLHAAVDSKEEVIFTDRDCRMQCFDAEHKVWTPKPPLDGKVDFVVPKKGEEEGLPIARLLFFVNRTGRLRLNSPVLPSSVRFRHPVERAAAKPAAAAAAGAAAAAAAAGPDTDASGKEKKDVPLKLNTVEFTGLKIDAKDSKDTTFYRIRFSSDERAKEFMALANAKQEEATKAAQNGSN